jgi:hypothetical protein
MVMMVWDIGLIKLAEFMGFAELFLSTSQPINLINC